MNMAAPAEVAAVKKIGGVVLDVQNISLSFGGVKALTDISFDVREHEIRAIIGPNGAGKSSMLNCINGVYQPQQGSITFQGRTFRHMNPRQVAARIDHDRLAGRLAPDQGAVLLEWRDRNDHGAGGRSRLFGAGLVGMCHVREMADFCGIAK